MREQKAAAYSVTPAEVLLLAGLVGATAWVGVDDPFLGLLGDEVDRLLAQSRQNLADRALLLPDRDGAAAIEAGLLALLRAVSLAPRLLLVSHMEDERPAEHRLVANKPPLMVEQTATRTEIVLAATNELEAMLKGLEGFLRLPQTPRAKGSPVLLPATSLDQARHLALAGKASQCRELLSGLAVPEEALEALVACLADGCQSGSSSIVERTGAELRDTHSLAWMIGPEGSWEVRPVSSSGPSELRLLPRSSDEVLRDLQGLALALVAAP